MLILFRRRASSLLHRKAVFEKETISKITKMIIYKE